MSELLIGAGSSRVKKLAWDGRVEWSALTTLDFNADHGCDVVHDIAVNPFPFPDSSFDEAHAYEVLEHVGTQGDWQFFFDQWSEFWRLLKPDGMFFGTTPHPTSPWAWGDPGHTRVIPPESFVFLDQTQYAQVGTTPMTDYRFCYRADFKVEHLHVNEAGQTEFVLRAVKPARTA